MRRALFMTMGTGLVALVVACGGGTAATQAPGAPGSTPAPGAQATPAPVAVPPAQACAGMPTFSLQTPQPSFRTDAELNAKFPTQISGQPVTEVHSEYWIDFLCYFPNNADAIAKFSQVFGGNLNAVSFGTGNVQLDGDDVSLQALRVAGGDASAIITHMGDFLLALGADPEQIQGMTTTTANLGGKNVTVFTDTDGTVTYIYASGDTAWSVNGVTEEQAGAIFAALP